VIQAEAGLSIGRLLRRVVPSGWTLPAIPATRHVTLGGAIAADIHGKNHRRAGSFAACVDRFTLRAPNGIFEVDRETEPNLFHATLGGLGLTGVVSDVTVSLQRSPSAWLLARRTRARDLDDVLARMADGADPEYRVAWIDAFARGKALGSGVVVGADSAPIDTLASRARSQINEVAWRRWCSLPRGTAGRTLDPRFIRLVNTSILRTPRRRVPRHPVRFDRVLMPLDAVEGWNRLYGPQGFVQYQFVVPDAQQEVIQQVLERLQEARCFSYFTTLKRLGPGDGGPLSFPMAGWSLSLDLPARVDALAATLDKVDETVAAVGGRVYLAKDSRMRPELLPVMYPRLGELATVRDRVDPAGMLRSDLARRLGLA
jgi:decaprenylphospho-beta-D-ribofuranose 2-oxidase